MSFRRVEPIRFYIQFAAWLGLTLTPEQRSSGGKTKLGGITKHGDSYLQILQLQRVLVQ